MKSRLKWFRAAVDSSESMIAFLALTLSLTIKTAFGGSQWQYYSFPRVKGLFLGNATYEEQLKSWSRRRTND
jgi:hypothetical protein